MKTIPVFLLSLTIAIVLSNPVWAHGGGGGAGSSGAGGGGSGAGGGGAGSSSGGGGGSSSSAGGGGNGGGGSSSSSAGGNGGGGGSHGGGGGHGGGDNGGSSSSSGAGNGGSTNADGGGKGGEMGQGGGKGVGVAHGLSNGLATAFGRTIGLAAKALGRGNGPEMSKGRGNGAAHGRGFGHASIGNPGHDALPGRSSHSENTSHRGAAADGRSFSDHTHAEHALAQNHVAHTTRADQAEEVDDHGPGKAKGFVNSLPSNQEPQAARSVTLNPSLDNDVALGLQPNQELQADSSRAVNPETIPSDPDGFTAQLLRLNHDPQADGGWKLNPDTIHSGLDQTLTRGLRSVLNLRSLHLREPDTDDTPVTKFPNRIGLQDWSALTSPDLDDDDVIGWRLVPFFGLVLVFLVTKAFSRQGVPRVFRRDAIRQPPNPQPQLMRGNNGRIDPLREFQPVALADFFDAEVVTAFAKKKSSKTLPPVLAEPLRGITLSEAGAASLRKIKRERPKP